MHSEAAISLPFAVLSHLEKFLRERNSPLSISEATTRAIEYWLENADWKPDLLGPTGDGYSWRNKDFTLYLPSGTKLRMKYHSQFHYAEVSGDEIIYQGHSLTPSQLAGTITGTSRNAWRDLWIKRPSDESWLLADDLRLKGSAQDA